MQFIFSLVPPIVLKNHCLLSTQICFFQTLFHTHFFSALPGTLILLDDHPLNSVVVSSPGYPEGEYPHNLDVQWEFATSLNFGITLELIHFWVKKLVWFLALSFNSSLLQLKDHPYHVNREVSKATAYVPYRYHF